MRAIVAHDAKDLRIDEFEDVKPGPGQVLIHLAAGGICGSDLHYFNNGGFGSVRLKEPMILGHEVSGHVAELGEGVEGIVVGELASILPSRPCGNCKYCHEGLRNHCLNMRFYGSAMPFPHVQGAFCEMLVVDAVQVVSAKGLTAGEAAMAEPLSVALHATRRAGEILGKRVLITGSGPIGALCIQTARRAGAAEIIATDLSANALDFALKVGADKVINMIDEPDALEIYKADKGYFDVHFECSGSPQALSVGISVMRPRGVVMQLGMGGDMEIPMMMITAKELDLRGSFRFHEEFYAAVEMMQKQLIDVKPLISHSIPFEDSLKAFDIANDRHQAMKTQIKFS